MYPQTLTTSARTLTASLSPTGFDFRRRLSVLAWITGWAALALWLAGSLTAKADSVVVPGNVTAVNAQANEVLVPCDHARVRLQLCAADTVRVSFAALTESFPPDETNMVMRYDWPPVARTVQETPEQVTLTTSALVLEIRKKPFQLALYSPGKTRLLTRTALTNGLSAEGERRSCRLDLDAGGATEHFYGLGMQFWRCDLRGTTRRMKMYQYWGARSEGEGETHYVNPFLLSTAGYGIYLHSSAISRFKLGAEPDREYAFETPLGGLDFYLFAGPDFKTLISAFSAISGRMALPPRYALGLTYRGIEKGATGDIFRKYAETFRSAGISLDIIGTEPTWQTKRYSHVWDPGFTPDPAGFIAAMTNLHVRVNLWERTEHVVKSMPGYEAATPYTANALADMTLAPARDAWFAGSRKSGFDLGVQGFKDDENDHWKSEPGRRMPGGMAQELYENLHPMLIQRNYWEQCRQAYNRRYFGWSRGNFTGGQRYPVAGYSDAFDFQDFIRATVNSGFWGAYFCPEFRSTSDHPNERLQLMFFGPFAVDNQYITGSLPVSSKGAVNPTYLKYDRLRYQLIPYLYSYFWQQHLTGIPVIRHTLMEFPRDPASGQQDLQYFFGRDLLVAPLYANPRLVYLPEGIWLDYWTGERYAGGRTILFQSPKKELPLFIRAGAVIPMQPEMNYVDEKPANPLTVWIAPGESQGFSLYEDDGLSLDYEKNDYAERPIQVATPDSKEIQITFGALQAPGAWQPRDRRWELKVFTGGEPASVDLAGQPLNSFPAAPATDGTEPGWWQTPERHGITCVRLAAMPATGVRLTIHLKTALSTEALYRTAYESEQPVAVRQLAELGKMEGSPAGEKAALQSALTEAEKLAADPATLSRALSVLNQATTRMNQWLHPESARGQVVLAADSTSLYNGAGAAQNFSRKGFIAVKHDSTLPKDEIRALLRFKLDQVSGTPRKVLLALSCLDAGTPLPGHDAIHAMLYRCAPTPDLAACTAESFAANPPKLEPLVDFFPVKDQTQNLDVTAAVRKALEEKRGEITFLIESIDEMGGSGPLRFASAVAFDNKVLLPRLMVQ